MYEAYIIFGIRVVILKNQKLGFQSHNILILPTQTQVSKNKSLFFSPFFPFLFPSPCPGFLPSWPCVDHTTKGPYVRESTYLCLPLPAPAPYQQPSLSCI